MGSFSEKVAERKYNEQNKQTDRAISTIILLGLFLPPLIGLVWAIPVYKHLKKKAAAERKL